MLLTWLPVTIALAGQAAPPPQTSPPPVRTAPAQVVGAPAQTPRPAPKQFNEAANAQSLIDAAVKAADTDDIRALVIWGANDNEQCAAFDTARRSRDVPGTMFSDEYKVAFVDVGKADRNLDVAKKYGVTLSADALPAMTVLDQRGNVLATVASRDLMADGATFDGKKIAALLAKYQAPPPDAVAQFEAGLKQAKGEGKTLFVWFSAPW